MKEEEWERRFRRVEEENRRLKLVETPKANELIMPITGWLKAGAAEAVVDLQSVVTFRDAFTDYMDNAFPCPASWIGRTVYSNIIFFAAGSTGVVRWECEVRYQTADGNHTSLTNTSAIIETNPGAANIIRSVTGQNSAIPASTVAFSLRLLRRGAHANDTRAASAYLTGLRLYVL